MVLTTVLKCFDLGFQCMRYLIHCMNKILTEKIRKMEAEKLDEEVEVDNETEAENELIPEF